MSAFIVDRSHIDALLTAGLHHTPSYPGDGFSPVVWWYEKHHKTLTRETADAVGRMLWWECFRSVGYCYPDGELPGPVGLTADEVHGYTFTRLDGPPDPVVVLSLIACYEYQTCEHPDWHASEAASFCESLRRDVIRRLPGYADAPWEATPDVFLRWDDEKYAGRWSA